MPGNAVTARLLPDRMAVRFATDVTRDSVFYLTDIVDAGLAYYGYGRIDLQIDSAGGSADSLAYFIRRLTEWRRGTSRLVLRTVGLTTVASAAAVMLSLGTVGHRQVYPSTRLLYHHGRILTQRPAMWTRAELEHHASALAAVDGEVLQALARHVIDGTGTPLRVRPWPRGRDHGADELDISTAGELRSLYDAAAARDEVMPPDAAVGLHLVDAVVGP